MSKIKLVALVIALAANSNLIAQANESSVDATSIGASGASVEVSPAKRELIKKLLAATESENRAQVLMQTMIIANEKTYSEIISRILSQDPNLTQDQRKQLESKLGETSQHFLQRYKELLPRQINISEVTEEVSMQVYNKYFTEAELKDLLAFYSTPTGQKAVKKMPELVQESMQMASAIILPKIQKLILELIEEERNKLQEPISQNKT